MQNKHQPRMKCIFLPRAKRAPYTTRGFTLIELLLVMGLTAFLLVVGIQSIVGSTAQFVFVNNYDKVSELVTQARSLAISGKAQLDETDFDNDQCKNVAAQPFCNAPDYVTPAHYGVHFQHEQNPEKYTVTLFADMHSKQGFKCMEGIYDPAPSYGTLPEGCDIILEKFELAKGLELVNLPNNQISIFYSPIFADVSFDVTPLPDDPFFIIGVQQTNAPVERKRCSQIHKLAGIAELMSKCP